MFDGHTRLAGVAFASGRFMRELFFVRENYWGCSITLSADREADIAQAAVFAAILAQRRAELCELLDEQAINLSRYARGYDTSVVRRKRLRIKEISAELRDIDRMVHQLRGRLLCADHG